MSVQRAQGAPQPAQICRDGQHHTEWWMVRLGAATSAAPLLACAYPGIVRSRILRDVRPERWELPRGKEHPFHGRNLVDAIGHPAVWRR